MGDRGGASKPGRGGGRGGATELLLEPDAGRQRGPHDAGDRLRRRPQLLVVVAAGRAPHSVAAVVHAPPPRELHARKHGPPDFLTPNSPHRLDGEFPGCGCSPLASLPPRSGIWRLG